MAKERDGSVFSTSKNHDNKSSLLKQSHPQVHLQHTDGDPDVQRPIGRGTRFSFEGLIHVDNNIQPKVRISKPDDVFEQQADRITEQVMSISEVDVNCSAAPSPTQGLNDALQPKYAYRDSEESNECIECQQQEQDLLQRYAVRETTPLIPAHIVHEVLRSPGQPLGPATRAFMEPRFSHDFSSVRVHTDGKAAESAQAVNSLAYTVGQDIVFGTGQYAPESSAGRKLLAHELAHVVQQSECNVEHGSTPRFISILPSPHVLARQNASEEDKQLVIRAYTVHTGGTPLTGHKLGPQWLKGGAAGEEGIYFVNGTELQFDLGLGAKQYSNIRPRQYAGPEARWIKRGAPVTDRWSELPTSGGNHLDDPNDRFVLIQPNVIAYWDSPGPNLLELLKERLSRIYVVQLFTGWIEGVPLTGGAAERIGEVVPWYSTVDLFNENWEDNPDVPKWNHFEPNTKAGWGWKPTTPP